MVSVQIKNDYLDAMGIEAWYPRLCLSNAPIPIQLLDQEPKLADVVVSEQLAELAVPIVKSAEPEVVAPQVKQATSEVTGESSDTIRFGLGLYVIDDYLIISSLVSDHELHQEPVLQLIQNIVKAVSKKKTNISHHHIISWPFFSNANADQGKLSAKKYVDSVIQHIKEQHHFTNVIVFGGVMPKLHNWTSADGEYYDIKRIVLPSVYRMLDNPSLKGKAWSLLKNYF